MIKYILLILASIASWFLFLSPNNSDVANFIMAVFPIIVIVISVIKIKKLRDVS